MAGCARSAGGLCSTVGNGKGNAVMDTACDDIVSAINRLPSDWHGSGTMPPDGIAAMAAAMEAIRPVRLSLETGSGKTTLLFSHLSLCHKVFSLDSGSGSVDNVIESPLFNAGSVEYVIGPTQRTLPAYDFPEPVDVALLDGPHGYPFPDLEYYHVYPHIRAGGLLMLDDIHIPTIRRMFDILRADAMWEELQVVGNLAILRRTAAEAVDAEEDGWWKQGYNRPLVERTEAYRRAMATGTGRMRRSAGGVVRRVIPRRVRRAARVLIDGIDA
jgi:hypothetical protein